jgi:MFS family permease
MSDRLDRRHLILGLAIAGSAVMIIGIVSTWSLPILVLIGFLSGGVTNPLYSLLVAYVNDYLDTSEMAGASAGLMFINGLGAIGGPLITGWFMAQMGPTGYFVFIMILFALMALYAFWRMNRRQTRALFRGRFRALSPTASAVAVEAAIETREEDTDAPANPA